MKRTSRKQTKAGGDQPVSVVVGEMPQRIFLYLQPKTVHYPIEENVSVEIELTHAKSTLTKLSDHFTAKNIIYLDEFNEEKPTFSITIKQDDITDVTNLIDTPLNLTLFENIILNDGESFGDRESLVMKSGSDSIKEEEEELMIIVERRPVAQGHIDLLEFFSKTRSRSSVTVFLYPLPTSSHRLTCKMEWEIYSLHPLIKQLIFSNVVFITLGSLYNMDEVLLNDCDDITVYLSFMSTMPNENLQYDKIPICSFSAFSKHIIGDQLLEHKWENLKSKQLANEQSLSIMAESKVNIQKLFHDLLRTENVDFNVEDIDPAYDYALICNSIHRYVLTDNMENVLEDVLAHNQYRIVLELIREREPDVVLLQGFIELSVFMFPQVSNCNFAIEMSPPGYKGLTIPNQSTENTPKNAKTKKGKRKGSATTNIEITRRSTAPPKEKTHFALIRICLDKPITEPRQNMIHIPKSQVKYQKLSKCPRKHGIDLNLNDICKENYCGFDETILDITDYMLRNNIKTIEDNKQFYCSQLGNMTNKIMRLVAGDFNVRNPTATNIEFTNLMTVVYQELMERVYNILMKCSSMKGLENCINTKDEVQKKIITRLNIAKYMFEIGNLEMSYYIMDKLRLEFLDDTMLNFYLFLYDVEREDFVAASEYLEKPLKEKYREGQLFVNIITIYITFKQELNDNDLFELAEENLISSLIKFCENNPGNIYMWILLFCLYKQHNYLPGMEYCRWKYDNLPSQSFFFLPPMPKSRWDMYMPYKLEFKSNKAKIYLNVVDLFLKLGLYQFAEWIYNEIATEAFEVEKYFMTSTFKIFLNKLEKKFSTKMFPVDKMLNSLNLRATLSQVNGNLEFFCNVSGVEAMKHYALLSYMNDLENPDLYSMGLLRYAYRMMEEKEYSKAKEAFTLCYCNDDGINVIAAIGKGKACYWLNDLDEAEMAFAQSTQYGLYMANVWAFLALINLRRGQNYKALECWKYARLNPNETIHMEILHELDKIDCSDINLYIDIPDQKSE